MARSITPRIIRGRLFYQTADVLFPTFAQAATAWFAAESHRLGIADEIDQLIVDRIASLAEMRRAGKDQVGFSAACKREAELAVRIRRLRAGDQPWPSNLSGRASTESHVRPTHACAANWMLCI